MGRTAARRAVHVGEALRALAQAVGMEARLQELDIRQVWARAVGRSVADHAQPVRLEGGRLLVHVSDSAWLHRLSLTRRDLARNVNNYLNSPAVKEIRFRIGPLGDASGAVRAGPPQPPTHSAPPPLGDDPALRRALEPVKALPCGEVVERILRRQSARQRRH